MTGPVGVGVEDVVEVMLVAELELLTVVLVTVTEDDVLRGFDE